MNYLYLPFFCVTVLMGIDEVFHNKRGLGLWESFGHPLDSFTVFVPMSYIAMNDYTEKGKVIFTILAIFSCIFITKDEWVHTKECSAMENWLHSVLFILHPLVFLCSGMLWRFYPDDEFLPYQAIAVGVFMLYQIFRWSLKWKPQMK
jgi:hypothetical protein